MFCRDMMGKLLVALTLGEWLRPSTVRSGIGGAPYVAVLRRTIRRSVARTTESQTVTDRALYSVNKEMPVAAKNRPDCLEEFPESRDSERFRSETLELVRTLLENTGRLDRTMGGYNGHRHDDLAFSVDGSVTVRGRLVCEVAACLRWARERTNVDLRLISVDCGRRTGRRGVVMTSCIGESGFESDSSKSLDDDFRDLMARLRAGDDAAETLVFRRFIDRLIVLASNQFDAWVRDRADVEGVVLSAYKSFFIRNGRGDFDLAGWDEMWALLAYITLRKCGKRQRFARAARRDTAREVSVTKRNSDLAWLPDRAPTPFEAATLNETVELLFQAMKPDDRPIVEHILMGYTAEQVAEQLHCSERTVRRVRQRAKHRLKRLVGGEIYDEEAV
jgi:RNA polymerase sigma factor (sigma-70 family)